MSSDWINNFAPINNHILSGEIHDIRNIDELYNKQRKDENVVRILELKGEVLSLINGQDDFDLLEDEKASIDDTGNDENFLKEIDQLNKTIHDYLKKFTDIQNELNSDNEKYQKEVSILKKNIETTETMINFIEKIPEEQKDQENIKMIIKQMNILSKNILNNEKIKDIRKNYIVKRKEAERLITFIKTINNFNQTNICPLCFTNTVDHFADPCGHTFCKDCIQSHIRKNNQLDIYELGRTDNSQCCFCRERINIVRPLYFL